MPTDVVAQRARRGGGTQWADGGRDVRMVTPQQAEVHAICSLRVGNRAVMDIRVLVLP
jgi:hypothetical protein